MKKAAKRFGCLLSLLAIGAGGGFLWMQNGIQPTPSGPAFYLRLDKNQALPAVLERLEDKGVVKDTTALRVYAWITRKPTLVKEGTYRFAPGMTADQILSATQKAVAQMVRLPETNWATRTAKLLEGKGVTSADEYMALVRSPSTFAEAVDFPLPKHSLEGYLYPDTYDLPPLLGAKGVIERQLKTFEKKVWPLLKASPDPRRTLIVASLVELEVASNAERAMVAGVIENRLKKGMRLEIDATVLFALGAWKALKAGETRQVISPYNTYLNNGLPPGPICSPSLASIEGALKPAKHEYLFYVVNPNKQNTHVFAKTYTEHLANVRKLRAARRAQAGR